MGYYWSFQEKHDANKEVRTVLCTGRAPSDRGLLGRFTQVLSPLLSLMTHYIAAWWRNPPLWVETGDLSLWLIEFRECRQKADSLTHSLPFMAQTALGILGCTQLSPGSWLPPAACKSPVKTETLLSILWFDLDETSHQVLLLFMAKYPQATESNFYPFSFRHKFAVFKVEMASDGRVKGKKKVLHQLWKLPF